MLLPFRKTLSALLGEKAPLIDSRIDTLIAAAQAHQDAGRGKEALDNYMQALALDPGHFQALYKTGDYCRINGNNPDAIGFFERAHHAKPQDVDMLCDLGETLAVESRFDDALAAYAKALVIAPDDANVHLGQAMTYYLKGDDAAFECSYQNVLRLRPDSAHAHAQYAHILFGYMEAERASTHYARALELDPDNTEVMAYYGKLLALRRMPEKAEALIERALQIEPDNIHALNAKGFFLLIEGRYDTSWQYHEYRLGGPGESPDWYVPGKPSWKGEVAPDKTLLIISEQGLGDTLQFVRYAELCRIRIGRVYVWCQSPLKSLLKNSPFIDAVFTGPKPQDFDVQIAMMSLPYIFKTEMSDIPAKMPYLFVDEHVAEKWRSRLSERPTAKPKIGLVWAGSTFGSNMRQEIWGNRRNMHLKHFANLLARDDIQLVNLQMKPHSAHIDELGVRDRFIDFMPDVEDMQDTAAIVQNLDLVITVDTSMSHLAGGLGVPVWVLSRYDACWRWLKNKPDNPWYPTAKVFGQPQHHDWDGAMVDVCKALDVFVASRR